MYHMIAASSDLKEINNHLKFHCLQKTKTKKTKLAIQRILMISNHQINYLPVSIFLSQLSIIPQNTGLK